MDIIKVKFLKNGIRGGRDYTYFSKELLKVGDVVQVNSHSKGVVTEVAVPEEEIADYRDKVKFVYGKAEAEPEEKEDK